MRLRRGLPPSPGPGLVRRAETPIPGLGRMSPPPVPIPAPHPRPAQAVPRMRRMTSEERRNWLRPVTDSKEGNDSLYD